MSVFSAYIVYNALLVVLQILHIIWFIMIMAIAVKAIRFGKVQKDDRSSSDEELSSGEPEENQNIKKIATNHNDVDGKLNSKPKQTNNHLR